ncbi:MAG TPA: CapA family protein [Candidatus Ozemobacteraceae bacterium]|nr:CapA family protein [Candidatus Ozemobacteraceae bacterium]
MSSWLFWLMLTMIDHLWLRIEFAGDLALGRNISHNIESAGPRTYFASLRTHLHSDDFVLANLEGAARPERTGIRVDAGDAHPGSHRTDRSIDLSFDSSAVPHLQWSGVPFFGLANNHSRDGGPKSRVQTIDMLSRFGLHGFSDRLRLTIKGIPIAIYALDLTEPSFPPDGLVADRANQIRHSAESCLTFVFMHAGMEDVNTISRSERLFVKQLIACGAAGVFGHHPHRVKEGGALDGRPVYHSLGSLVFDRTRKPDCFGLLVRVHIWAGTAIAWETFVAHLQPGTHRPLIWPRRAAAGVIPFGRMLGASALHLYQPPFRP